MSKYIKKLIYVFFVITITFKTFGESNVIMNINSKDFFDNIGPGFATEMAVAGDSYAQHFYEDEKDKDIKLFGYFNEGLTLSQNEETLKRAFNSIHKLIFLSISVNDRHGSTHPSVFENELRSLFDIAVETNKIVILHSYMYYDLASTAHYPYSTYEYDSMLRNLIMEYKNVYYVDMSDCTGSEYMLPDGIHYNKKFNDEMYNRLLIIIDFIKDDIYE